MILVEAVPVTGLVSGLGQFTKAKRLVTETELRFQNSASACLCIFLRCEF